MTCRPFPPLSLPLKDAETECRIRIVIEKAPSLPAEKLSRWKLPDSNSFFPKIKADFIFSSAKFSFLQKWKRGSCERYSLSEEWKQKNIWNGRRCLALLEFCFWKESDGWILFPEIFTVRLRGKSKERILVRNYRISTQI